MGTVTIITVVAGAIATGILGIAHSYLKRFDLHKTINYVIGSAVNLLAVWVALKFKSDWTNDETMFLLLGVWGMTGTLIIVLYIIDNQDDQSLKRAGKAHRSKYSGEHKD